MLEQVRWSKSSAAGWGFKKFSRCYIRGESEKGRTLALKPQGARHQKSKIGIPTALQKELMSAKSFFKLRVVNACTAVNVCMWRYSTLAQGAVHFGLGFRRFYTGGMYEESRWLPGVLPRVVRSRCRVSARCLQMSATHSLTQPELPRNRCLNSKPFFSLSEQTAKSTSSIL